MKQAGNKSGSLSDGGKEPPFKGGLDWAAIRRCHRPPEEAGEPLPVKMQLDIADIDRRNRGVNTYYGRDKEEQKAAARRGGKRTRTAPFDIDEVIRLYVEEKLGVADIALKVTSSQETVRKYLRRAEVYDPQRDKHHPKRSADTYERQEHCAKGHDLSLPGAAYDVWKTRDGKRIRNGRSCVECKKDRDKEQRFQEAKKRLACPDTNCSHGGIKHSDHGCQVRDCHCTNSHAVLRIFWESQ